MAKSLDAAIDRLQKRVDKISRQSELFDPVAQPGEKLLSENDRLHLVELVEFLDPPSQINNLKESGQFLKKIRARYSKAELLSWLMKFQQGNFWPRLTKEMKSALLEGNTEQTMGEVN